MDPRTEYHEVVSIVSGLDDSCISDQDTWNCLEFVGKRSLHCNWLWLTRIQGGQISECNSMTLNVWQLNMPGEIPFATIDVGVFWPRHADSPRSTGAGALPCYM